MKNKKDLVTSYKYLGYYYVKLGNDNAMSLANFQKAAELDPTNTEVLDNISKLGGAVSTQVAPVAPKN